MTFKVFNALNELFKQGKTVALRQYDDDGYHTVATFDQDDEIGCVDDYLKRKPNGELFVFDGDTYEEVEL